MIKMGVLALQGSVIEHVKALEKIDNVEVVLVKYRDQIDQIDGIILPGGESTTLGKLLRIFDILEPLQKRILKGMPVYGTCAGMILLSKDIIGETPIIGLMDIRVRRNAYGRQIDSFKTKAMIPSIANEPIELVFIRAPWIEKVQDNVRVLLRLNDHIVAAQQDNMLVTSFHPELTRQLYIHKYFIEMIQQYKKGLK